jgi:tetratricopeptide (TPR) repeat protein
MKKIELTRTMAESITAALAAATLLLAVLLAIGCTAEPEPIEEPAPGPDPVLMENAGRLIEGASPEQLREAVQMLQGPARSFPEAQGLASFAVALFDLLYPELAGSEYLNAGSISAYRGAYSRTLERARSGQPPLSGTPSGGDVGEDFFDLVVPALFLARLSDPAAVSPSELSSDLELLDQARRRNRSSALPPYLQGRIRELEGDPDRAATLYRESLDRAPSFYPASQALAILLLKKGEAEQAVALLEQIEEQLPQVGSARYPLAQAYYETGQLEAASTTVAKVLLEDPDRPDALLLRARVLAAEGNWNQALRVLNLLFYQHPDNREAYLLAARLRYEEAADPEGALELLAEAEDQFPEAAEFPELSGRIYLDTGRDGEGLIKLQRALDLDPGRVSTLKLLLSNAMDMQRWLQSAMYLSEILEQEQSEEDLLQAIEIYRSLGDPAQVLYYAEQLYRANPSVENLVVYAQALLAGGQEQQAADLVQQGLEQAQTPALHSTLLTLQASLTEDPQEALALVREALMEHPQNYLALVKITELYVDQRQLRKASLYLKQAIALDPNNAALRVQLQSIEKALGTQGTQDSPENSR